VKHAVHNSVHHYPRLSLWIIFWLAFIVVAVILGAQK
jgi:hypothetical protein